MAVCLNFLCLIVIPIPWSDVLWKSNRGNWISALNAKSQMCLLSRNRRNACTTYPMRMLFRKHSIRWLDFKIKERNRADEQLLWQQFTSGSKCTGGVALEYAPNLSKDMDSSPLVNTMNGMSTHTGQLSACNGMSKWGPSLMDSTFFFPRMQVRRHLSSI